jgi:hypothetical protein
VAYFEVWRLQFIWSNHVKPQSALPVSGPDFNPGPPLYEPGDLHIGTLPSVAYTVFALSEAGIVVSNPTQSIDVWYVCLFFLCLCCPVFRWRPCDEMITSPTSPTVCKIIKKLRNQPCAPKWEQEVEKKTGITDNWLSMLFLSNFMEIYWDV